MANNVLRSRTYSYTLAGMISKVDMETGGKVEYAYDSLDRLTSEKVSDVYGQVLSRDLYEYDLAGNRTRKTILDANSNALMTVNYTLTTGNRLAAWTVSETNLMARFPVVGHASETIGANDRFGYLWVSNATAGGTAVKPEVDGTNFWVSDFTVGLGTQKIVAAIRDVAGNMGYTTNTIIPSVMTNGAYQYNAAGCLTNIAMTGNGAAKSLGLAWDGQYQLTAVSTNGGVVESYKFDAFGRRVMTASAGVTNWHVYDLAAPSAGGQAGGLQVIADLDSTGAVVRTYVWGPGIDNLLAMTIYGGTTNTYYALKDHLNSVLALTDSSGRIVEQYRYDAWGRTTVFDGNGNPLSTSTVGNRYCWQGREYSWTIHAANNGNGLYYFRARWYDPVTGRWLSNDPIGISGGLNQYVFCANNPVNFVDPFGLRDVNVYVWEARGIVINSSGSAGHIMVAEYKSTDVILSQFPHKLGEPRTSEGPNTLLNWKDTYTAMGRPPDAIYTVNVPDDKAFDAEACKQRKKPTWNWKPSALGQTHCARAAYDALRAGGVPIPANPGQAMPGTLGSDLQDLIGKPNVTVRQGF